MTVDRKPTCTTPCLKVMMFLVVCMMVVVFDSFIDNINRDVLLI